MLKYFLISQLDYDGRQGKDGENMIESSLFLQLFLGRLVEQKLHTSASALWETKCMYLFKPKKSSKVWGL